MWELAQKFLATAFALLAIGLILWSPRPSGIFGGPLGLLPVEPASGILEQEKYGRQILMKGQQSAREELPRGETHTYLITVNSGEYLRVLVEQWNMAASGAINDPDGHQLVAFHCFHRGPTPASLIAKVSGIYRLDIRSSATSSTGEYTIRLESLRPVKPRDESRIAAEKAFAEGDKLRMDWRIESSRKAIEKYEMALPLWKALGERREEVLTLKTIGEVWHSISEFQKALQSYTAALSLSRKIDDRLGESEILSAIGYVYFYLGDIQKALQLGNRSLELSRTLGNRPGIAQALNIIGEAYSGSGDMSKGLDYYQQALSVWRDLKDRQGQALALLNSGYTYSDLSNTQNALSSYDQALILWNAMQNQRGKAQTLTAIGHLKSKLGEKQEALKLYKEARQLYQPMGDRVGEGFVLNGMGFVYDELSQQQTALGYYSEALQLFRNANYRNGEAGSLWKIGRIHYSLRDYPKALDFYHRSLTIYRALYNRRTEPYLLDDIGKLYGSLGERRNALNHFNQALVIIRAGRDWREEAYLLNSIGHVHENMGATQKALDYFTKALPLNLATGDRFGQVSTLYNMAQVQRDLGNLTEARSHAEAAISIAESLRSNVVSQELRSSYSASVHRQFELYIDTLMLLHKNHPTRGLDRAALEATERGRARSFLEIIAETRAGIREGVNLALVAQERELQKLLNTKANRHMQLLSEGNANAAEILSKEVDHLTEQHDDLKTQIRVISPRYAALTQPQPLTATEIQQRIVDDNSLLLEYAIGDERSYLWAVTSKEVWSYELPGRAEIEAIARDTYNLLTANHPVPGESFEQRQGRVTAANEQLPSQIEKLSKVLIEPVAARLGSQRLLIVPDGALQYIPFQILTKPSARSGTNAKVAERVRLVADHEIVNEPSASALALLRSETSTRKPASNSVAVLADPVFESDDPRISGHRTTKNETAMTAQLQESEMHRALRDVGVNMQGSGIPRLLASQYEADAIMAVAPCWSGFKAIGFEASRATAMKSELGDYRIVHFATHGLLNNEHPELSGIVLSLVDKNGQPQDGFLRLHDIYNLKLPVDLVVLSACNTGLGKDVRGEGLIGLTRGFMYAGASSVVASLWKVDDAATAELMRYFYAAMLKEGLSPAAALRKAQLEMLKQKRWHSPYYWSGFIIQGQYLPTERRVNSSFNSRALLGGVVAILVLACLLVLRRRRSRVL